MTSSNDRRSRPILVTGASTGIGRAAAVRLAGLGYTVFAGARKPADLEELKRIPNVTPVPLDVRDAGMVAEALETVRARGGGLYGLVNNAGVGGIGPIASFTDDELRDVFEINVFGVFRMTREFLPLVLAAKGRVVIVGSQAGSISMRWYGPYSMTKHALEAMALALDLEVRPHGARAAIIQPGAVATDIGRNSIDADRARFLRAPTPFDSETRKVAEALGDLPDFDPSQPESASNRNPCPPDTVALVIQDVLESPDPPLRTLVGTRWEGNRAIGILAERLVQANACPSLRYSREKLMEWLDRAAK